MSWPAQTNSQLAVFERERPRLVRLAHRMLGSFSDAEDLVQSAWLRWNAADAEGIARPEAWLTRTVTHLAIDAMRSARARREIYVGEWLPEPVVAENEEGIDDDVLSTALMMALERLSPLERAAFLLHDVFGMGFDDIAGVLDRAVPACRKLASRARSRVRAGRPRLQVKDEEYKQLAQAFFTATRSGDTAALADMLAEHVVVHSDGGGLRRAALRPLIGRDRVLRLFEKLAARFDSGPSELLRIAAVDGLPGFVTREADGLLQTTALQVGASGIDAIFVVRNPDKLRHLEAGSRSFDQR